MPGCEEPTRLSMDRARRRLFAVCQRQRDGDRECRLG
jgi:hypothetical protein